jgi:hypothetical protein
MPSQDIDRPSVGIRVGRNVYGGMLTQAVDHVWGRRTELSHWCAHGMNAKTLGGTSIGTRFFIFEIVNEDLLGIINRGVISRRSLKNVS